MEKKKRSSWHYFKSTESKEKMIIMIVDLPNPQINFNRKGENMEDKKEQLARLKSQLLELECKDHWDLADYHLADELERKIKALEEELEKGEIK